MNIRAAGTAEVVAAYRHLRLDTLAAMEQAIAMYLKMGFERIAPYSGPTPPGTVCLERRL